MDLVRDRTKWLFKSDYLARIRYVDGEHGNRPLAFCLDPGSSCISREMDAFLKERVIAVVPAPSGSHRSVGSAEALNRIFQSVLNKVVNPRSEPGSLDWVSSALDVMTSINATHIEGLGWPTRPTIAQLKATIDRGEVRTQQIEAELADVRTQHERAKTEYEHQLGEKDVQVQLYLLGLLVYDTR
ncbi:hypothetical protein F5Y02DRAFT_170715 [Annulohypoxylon stygium]|nr:hypothetical protein F5Y02DRAFT_170715 [Annulohypoxylon stygium]